MDEKSSTLIELFKILRLLINVTQNIRCDLRSFLSPDQISAGSWSLDRNYKICLFNHPPL